MSSYRNVLYPLHNEYRARINCGQESNQCRVHQFAINADGVKFNQGEVHAATRVRQSRLLKQVHQLHKTEEKAEPSVSTTLGFPRGKTPK